MKLLIKERYRTAIADNNVFEIQEIVSELNGMKASEKKKFLDLYTQIGEDLFQNSSEINNYDLEGFIISSNQPEAAKGTSTIASGALKIINDNFQEVLLEFLSRVGDICVFLKAHFLFQLDNDSSGDTKIIVLNDKVYQNNPLIQRILEKYSSSTIHRSTLVEFIAACNKDSELTNKKYLCLLALPTNILYDGETRDNIKDLFQLFGSSSLIKLSKDTEITAKDYQLEQITLATYSHIENICSKVFNNRDISYQEEIIIKKCFPSTAPIIDYKILKSGFSGSKVIEAQPIKHISGKTGRFVIKYSKKDSDRKIFEEQMAFEEYVEDFSIPGYYKKYVETDLYEAIKYNYASSDAKKESYPFAKLMKDLVKGNMLPYDLKDVINQLFACPPFRTWQNTTKIVSTGSKLYVDYFNEHKIIESIGKINAESDEEVKNGELWKNIKLISDFSFDTFEKVCHGDLHSENFFKDDDDVYLIDFGYTRNRHAVIDHTTLEASLKFKHVPIYIPIEELNTIELQLLDPLSFELGFKIISKRPIVNEIFNLILIIRQNAAQLIIDRKTCLEYYLSLFFISLRQIQYGDLNQRYALQSSIALSRKIIDLIS